MPLKPGFVLHHRYRIENVLGQGGMGAVYKAVDINLGVSVAVKENLFTTEEFARQFHREATILAGLRHANLPRVTDHFVVEGEGQYLVMDFIQGADLRQRLESSGPVPEEECLPWFLEICDALAYLHSLHPPILHRDIKPGNIKITPEGRAMLVDFGLAKVVESDGTTTTGAKAMTPGFSPPEQYGTGRTDPRTDIYSLGATLYATLTAMIPEDSLERAMGRDELTPLRKRNPKVSPSLARVVEKALEYRPEGRFQSVGEFAAALSSASAASHPTVAGAHPYLERSTLVRSPRTTIAERVSQGLIPLRWRGRWPIMVLSLFTVALVIGGAAYAVPNLGGRLARFFARGATQVPPTLSAVAPATTVEPTVTLPLVPTTIPTATELLPATAPPGQPTPIGGGVGQIAFASIQSGLPQLFLVNADGTGLVQLTHMPDGACQPSWSPDGTRLAFTSPCRTKQDRYEGAGIWVVKVDGTGLEPLQSAPGGDYDPAWAPDGKHIAFTSLRGGGNIPHVYVMALDGSGLKNLSEGIARDAQPSWDPSGSQLLFTAHRGGASEIWIVPAAGGSAKRFILGGGEDDLHPEWSHDGKVVLFVRTVSNIPRLAATQFETPAGAVLRICPEGPREAEPMEGPSWSPDDRWIVFETWPSGANHEIAIMTSSCTNYTLLTHDKAFDFDPAWRP
jgi:serine/threonine-protein kinase